MSKRMFKEQEKRSLKDLNVGLDKVYKKLGISCGYMWKTKNKNITIVGSGY